MKVLSLGGAGAVCEHATRDLVAFSNFEEIVIGEYDVSAAEALAKEMDDPRVKVLAIDAGDYRSLVETFRGFDVILNGLPFKYDMAVTKACVEAGVSGLDVSTEESQWDYDAAAKEKGIVFIPGVGATPGITNVMARRGAELVEELDEVQINFAAFRCLAPSAGLLTTTLWEFYPPEEGRVYYKDGQYHWVGPFEGLKIVDYPGPIGKQEVCYIPHPETRTISKSLGAKAVSVHGCFPPPVMRLMRAMVDSGLFSDVPIDIGGAQVSPREAMAQILFQLPESKQNPLWGYGLVVEVFGKREGKPVKVKLWNRHPSMEEWGGKAAYYKNIAIPLSIGVQMIAGGDISACGVVPPETAIPPQKFFDELHRRGIEIHEMVERIA
jgi:saccharopine dehydrogenase-like NADP-dependent oxidoreductase